MRDIKVHASRIEIAHRTGAYADRADRQSRVLSVEMVEIDQFLEPTSQRLSGVEGCPLEPDRQMDAPGCVRIHLKKPRDPLGNRRKAGYQAVQEGRRPHIVKSAPAGEAGPELQQLLHARLGGIACDDGAVYGADRGAD